MPYKKVLAGASVILLAFVAVPAAYAANDGDRSAPKSPVANAPSQTSPAAKYRRVMDPAKRAVHKAKRQARDRARQQQEMQGAAPN